MLRTKMGSACSEPKPSVAEKEREGLEHYETKPQSSQKKHLTENALFLFRRIGETIAAFSQH
jgi:hypothetical protein